jgi:multidrug resistance efflux pump
MFELMFCSILTILPDYLYRRYGQGKRFGHEITLFSVWYELRWGITACLLLTVSLITVVFYFHPASTNVTSFYRTVPVLPEMGGRVVEIYVGVNEDVAAGQPLFRLDSSVQQTALETARLKVDEIDAQIAVAQADLATAEAKIAEAEGAYQQALDELATKEELRARNPDVVPTREIDRLRNLVSARLGALSATEAQKNSLETSITTLLPAQKGSAIAQVAEAQAALDKAVVFAGVDGRMQQFSLRVGDYVNPMLRPAGILVPKGAGTVAFQAGFGQISAQVLKVGMTAEMSCASDPFKVNPMVVTEFQDVISSGQLRQSDLLVEAAQVTQPGTVLVYMEPMFPGGTDGIPPGSTCFANAYTSNYDRLHSDEQLSSAQWLALHAIDTVGLVHAMLLRIQVILVPMTSLVFSGGH